MSSWLSRAKFYKPLWEEEGPPSPLSPVSPPPRPRAPSPTPPQLPFDNSSLPLPLVDTPGDVNPSTSTSLFDRLSHLFKKTDYGSVTADQNEAEEEEGGEEEGADIGEEEGGEEEDKSVRRCACYNCDCSCPSLNLSALQWFSLVIGIWVVAVAVISVLIILHVFPFIPSPSPSSSRNSSDPLLAYSIEENDPNLQQLLTWKEGNLTLLQANQTHPIQYSTIPINYVPGYVPTPSPQLPPTGPLSGVPAQFAIRQTGLVVPHLWGTAYQNAKARGYFEIAILGDDIASTGLPAKYLGEMLVADGYGPQGTGWIAPNNALCSFSSSSIYLNSTYGGIGGGWWVVPPGQSITCTGLQGTSFRWDIMQCSSCGLWKVTANGQITPITGSSSSNTTGVYSIPFNAPSGTPTQFMNTDPSLYVNVFGIKAWFSSGFAINTYAQSSGLLSGRSYAKGASISQWRGPAGPLQADQHIEGDLVLCMFINGDVIHLVDQGVYVGNVDGMIQHLIATAPGTGRDVLFLRMVYTGFWWDFYGVTLLADSYFMSGVVAMLDLSAWFDYSPMIMQNLGGYVPCSSTNLPSQGSYCWNQGDQFALSDVGYSLCLSTFYPLLNGQGFYNNSGTWPREQFRPGAIWPTPVPAAALNRPIVPTATINPGQVRLKKGLAIEPEGTHPILYNCSMILSVDISTYYTWSQYEQCAYEWSQQVLNGLANATDYPQYMPLIYSESQMAWQGSTIPPVETSPFLALWNEPNGYPQAGSPIRAAQMHPLYEATGRNIVLAAPSQEIEDQYGASQWVYSWTDWFATFLFQCVLIHGRACEYDFVALHWYDDNVADVLNAIEILYAMTGRPVILTEFGTADDNIPTYLSTVESNRHLYRYQWYALRGFCPGDSYGGGFGGLSVYTCINAADLAVYLGGTGDASLLSQPVNTLAMTSIGKAFTAYQSIPPQMGPPSNPYNNGSTYQIHPRGYPSLCMTSLPSVSLATCQNGVSSQLWRYWPHNVIQNMAGNWGTYAILSVNSCSVGSTFYVFGGYIIETSNQIMTGYRSIEGTLMTCLSSLCIDFGSSTPVSGTTLTLTSCSEVVSPTPSQQWDLTIVSS
jgi:hypothetical protein